jgi:hypothetical protein
VIIPVVADLPSTCPGLGFQEYAEAIADAVRGGEPPQFTIGLFFYSDRDPSVRFVITKHVARFEKRKKNQPWRLWESYLLTTETGSALKVVDSPEAHFTKRN